MTKEKNKPRVMVWLLVATFITGALILVGSIWDWTKIPVTPTTILWFVTILVLLIFGLMLWGSSGGSDNSPRQRQQATATVAQPAHVETHPPAHASGHGGHGGASGALGWLLLAIVLGILALVYVGKKAGFGVIPGVGGYGRDAGAHAPASYSSHQDGVSLDWVPFKAPTSTWYTIRSRPGYDVEVCDPVADPNCTDPPLRGYRARCVDMTATEKVWTQSGCRNFIRIMIQATGRDPLPLVWRHVPRVNP